MQPILTIGMPTYDDNQGLWATINGIKTAHPEVLQQVELLVVDNNPGMPNEQGRHRGKQVGERVNMVATSLASRGVYFPFPWPVGSAVAKNEVFKQATGKFVLCVDSHTMFERGTLQRLLDFVKQLPENDINLYTGPMLNDTFGVYGTHFNDVWSSDMRGQFQKDPRGEDRDGPAFEIPAMGCGLMLCRKEAWPGFHQDLFGFGAEEWYIHDKFRKQGGKVYCVPFLRWYHRFLEVKRTFSIYTTNTVRNYLIGFNDIGDDYYRSQGSSLEEQVQRCKAHFVSGEGEQETPGATTTIEGDRFDRIAADPIKAVASVTKEQKELEESLRKSKGQALPIVRRPPEQKPSVQVSSMEDIFGMVSQSHSDIQTHLGKLKELASQCDMVVELGTRRGVSTAAILAGKPKKFQTYDINKHDSQVQLFKLLSKKDTDFDALIGDSTKIDIPETDMLFIDTLHTYDQLKQELQQHGSKVKHWIVLHDTETFGRVGEGHSKETPRQGLLPAVREYMRDNPQWSVVYRSQESNGLMVLSCQEQDKPPLPDLITQGKNYAKALTGHLFKGRPTVTDEVKDARLSVCDLCEHRHQNNCSLCGCQLAVKAGWADQACPISKWEAYLERDVVKEAEEHQLPAITLEAANVEFPSLELAKAYLEDQAEMPVNPGTLKVAYKRAVVERTLPPAEKREQVRKLNLAVLLLRNAQS